MPKVTQQYMDARREEIMDAARRCFLKDGFHSTSMQDIFAASGLSAGAVYRHFAKKEDIILAISEANMADVVGAVRSAAARGGDRPVGDMIGEALDAITQRAQERGLARLAVLVWSETLRNPSLRERYSALIEQLRRDLTDVIGGQQRAGAPEAAGTAEAAATASATATTLVCVLAGFIAQTALLGGGAVDTVPDTVRQLWHSPATG